MVRGDEWNCASFGSMGADQHHDGMLQRHVMALIVGHLRDLNLMQVNVRRLCHPFTVMYMVGSRLVSLQVLMVVDSWFAGCHSCSQCHHDAASNRAAAEQAVWPRAQGTTFLQFTGLSAALPVLCFASSNATLPVNSIITGAPRYGNSDLSIYGDIIESYVWLKWVIFVRRTVLPSVENRQLCSVMLS